MKLTQGLIGSLKQKMRSLEKANAWQKKLITRLQDHKETNMHSMEVEEHKRVAKQALRRDNMSDEDCREELQKQYGYTGWAKSLIESIMARRPSNS